MADDLGPFMVREPDQAEPVRVHVTPGTPLAAGLADLCRAARVAADAALVIASRGDAAPTILGAVRGGACLACGAQVWLSPSSRRVAGPVALFCLPCVSAAARAYTPAPGAPS